MVAVTAGALERESYTLINKKQSIKNALLMIYIKDILIL